MAPRPTPLSPFRHVVAGTAKPAILNGLKSSFDPRVRPAGVSILGSTVCLERIRHGMLACRHSREKDGMRSYYWSLSYADLGEMLQVTRRFGVQYMNVIVESFCMCALELSSVGTHSRKQRHQMCMVRAKICEMRYINDP